MSGLTSVEHAGLGITSDARDGEIIVRLSGTCDSQTRPVLDSFLSNLHDEAMRLGAKRVALDCENLYFMNSASVKSFVTWLTKVKALTPKERYSVSVRTNRHLSWQHRSFGAIGRSAPDVLSIDQ